MVVDAKSKVIEEVEIPDTEIEILGRTHQKVGMGNHDGNRFTITVEDVWMRMVIHLKAKRQCQGYCRSRIHERALGIDAFPNWIGPRGLAYTTRDSRGRRGVVESDFEGAVSTYLGMKGMENRADVEEFRKLWRETKMPLPAWRLYPSTLF